MLGPTYVVLSPFELNGNFGWNGTSELNPKLIIVQHDFHHPHFQIGYFHQVKSLRTVFIICLATVSVLQREKKSHEWSTLQLWNGNAHTPVKFYTWRSLLEVCLFNLSPSFLPLELLWCLDRKVLWEVAGLLFPQTLKFTRDNWFPH